MYTISHITWVRPRYVGTFWSDLAPCTATTHCTASTLTRIFLGPLLFRRLWEESGRDAGSVLFPLHALLAVLGTVSQGALPLRSLPTQPVVGLRSHETKGYKTQGAGAFLMFPEVSTAPAGVLSKPWPMLPGVSQGLNSLFWISF